MKVTRFTQSCILIEDAGSRIVIDPSAEDAAVDFGKLDAALYTHEHADHFDPTLAEKFITEGVPVYANPSTAKQIKEEHTVVNDGQEFSAGSIKLKVIELPHCLMPDGSQGPQNVGYLINERLFHPGDGKELDGLKVETLLLPIFGPDISFKDASDLAKQLSAKTVIPIHYDFAGTKPEFFDRLTGFFERPYDVKIIELGKSLDL